MIKIRAYLLLLTAALSLSACTAVQEISQAIVDDVRAGSTFGFTKQEPAHQWIEEDQKNVASYMSNDSVEVYSLDSQEYDQNVQPQIAYQPEAYGGADNAFARSPQSVVSTDTSVTLYPIDSSGIGHYQVEKASGIEPPAMSRASYSSSPGQEQITDQNFYSTPPAQYGGFQQEQPRYTAPSFSELPTSSRPAFIYYTHGVTSLNPTGRTVIDNVAEIYRAAPGGSLHVEGYASIRSQTNDPVKREMLNLKTSMDRAINVSQELIKKGVPANAIRTIAYGDTKPAVAQPGISVEDASRRVEIYSSPPSY